MAVINNRSLPADYCEFSGLSTDTKPTTNVGVNSLFLELDTNDKYYFDGASWNKIGGTPTPESVDVL